MSIKCPHCEETFAGSVVGHVPDEQRVTFAIQFEGERLNAKTVGGVITNFAELMGEIANTHAAEVSVFVDSFDYTSGELKIGFFVLGMKSVAPAGEAGEPGEG